MKLNSNKFNDVNFQRDGYIHMIHSDIIDYFQSKHTNIDMCVNKYSLKYIPNNKQISVIYGDYIMIADYGVVIELYYHNND